MKGNPKYSLLEKHFDPRPSLMDKLPELYSSFDARRPVNARVAWLNERYWAQNGWDVTDTRAVTHLRHLLLERYCFCVPLPEDDAAAFYPEIHRWYADRYGGPHGAVHGGSARAAVIGDFIIKGVGRTSLASDDADCYHSNGHLWLDEALKDALYSELSYLECTRGAIPTAAIIDIGLDALLPCGSNIGRRALSLRPFPLRLAHLERSIYFIKPEIPAAQAIDAARVRGMCREVFEQHGNDVLSELRRIVARVAEQIGACWFWRLSHDFTSANTSLDGALLDFGGFYGLRDWQRVKKEPCRSTQQDDFADLRASLRSVSFFASKYLNCDCRFDMRLEQDALLEIAKCSFEKEVRQIIGMHTQPDFVDELVNLIWAYFAQAQQLTVDYTFTPPRPMHGTWLGDLLADDGLIGSGDAMDAAAAVVRDFLASGGESSAQARVVVRTRLIAALTGREALQIENVQTEVSKVINSYKANEGRDVGDLATFVNRTLVITRRRFSYPSDDFVAVVYGSLGWIESTIFFDEKSGKSAISFACFAEELQLVRNLLCKLSLNNDLNNWCRTINCTECVFLFDEAQPLMIAEWLNVFRIRNEIDPDYLHGGLGSEPTSDQAIL